MSVHACWRASDFNVVERSTGGRRGRCERPVSRVRAGGRVWAVSRVRAVSRVWAVSRVPAVRGEGRQVVVRRGQRQARGQLARRLRGHARLLYAIPDIPHHYSAVVEYTIEMCTGIGFL